MPEMARMRRRISMWTFLVGVLMIGVEGLVIADQVRENRARHAASQADRAALHAADEWSRRDRAMLHAEMDRVSRALEQVVSNRNLLTEMKAQQDRIEAKLDRLLAP